MAALRQGMELGTDDYLTSLRRVLTVFLIGSEIAFGDGTMSAINFTLDIEKVEDAKGDRVKVIMNGKFLPYKKW